MDKISQATDYVTDKVKGTGQEAERKSAQEGAEDSNAPITSRISDAGSTVKHGAKEASHKTSAEGNKEEFKHGSTN